MLLSLFVSIRESVAIHEEHHQKSLPQKIIFKMEAYLLAKYSDREVINLIRNIDILTNNGVICDKFNGILKVTFIDGGFIDVLYGARDKIHGGSILVSHPLMGSVKPNETPYRSIILEDKKGSLDFQSLSIIESSIESCRKLLQDKPTPDWTPRVLDDFKFLDMKLLESALSSIGVNC